MTTSAAHRTPRGKGRPWVALFTTFLGDTDLVLAGQNARTLYPLLLLHSAEQGLAGHVPSDPRRVQLFAHFDGGCPAVAEALDALVACDKLERVEGDISLLYIRTWADYQVDIGGSTTRSPSMVLANARRYHAAGKHTEPRAGCPACETEAAEPDAQVSGGTTADEVRAKVTERCDAVLRLANENGEDVLETYLGLYEFVGTQVPRFANVTGIDEPSLLKLVVRHAGITMLTRDGRRPAEGTLKLLDTLRRDHGSDVLRKLASSLEANNPAAYLRGCYPKGSAA